MLHLCVLFLCLVAHTKSKAANPMLAIAKIKPMTFLAIASGVIIFMFSRSCIVILGEFPAFALGYLSGYGEIDMIRIYSTASR